MAIESISAGRTDYASVSPSSAAQNSQWQSKEASARVTEPVTVTSGKVSSLTMEGDEEAREQFWEPMDNETLKRRISDLNKQLNNTECQYGIHEKTQRVTLKIVDKETKKVLKEFPAEKTLEMIAKVWEMAGLLVDEKR